MRKREKGAGGRRKEEGGRSQEEGADLVVDEARVGSEDTHRKDVVAALVERAEHLILRQVRELLLVQHQQQTHQRHHDTCAPRTLSSGQ
eukprot:1684903-Rhodomonas_salina.5